MARWTFPGGIGGGVCRCGAVAMLVWLTGGVLSAGGRPTTVIGQIAPSRCQTCSTRITGKSCRRA